MATLRNMQICLGAQSRLRLALPWSRWLQSEAGGTEETEHKGLTREEYNAQFEEYQQALHAFRVKALAELKEKRESEQDDRSDKKHSLAEVRPGLTVEEQRLRAAANAKARELHHQKYEAARLRRESDFKRESLRRQMLAKAEEERYKTLLESSRTWITEETLDERIKQALNRVSNLY